MLIANISLEIPTPPSGSDYDQSTINYSPDTSYVVAGEINGNPAHECYIAQGFANNRPVLTGFGAVLGVTGTVTNNLYLLISDGLQNPNDPGSVYITGATLDPSGLVPGNYYYCYVTLSTPVPLTPGKVYYLIACTDEPWTEANGWVWAGMSTAPYTTGPVHAFNGTNWTEATADMMFFTWTETEVLNCGDYTNQTDCEAAGCYWCDGICQSQECGVPPVIPCDSYKTESTCKAATGCFWYQKYFWEEPKCHDVEQNMIMDYLPFIIAGVGGTIILAALVMRPAPAPAPAPAYPPYPPYPYGIPPQYYPPPRR